MGYCQGDPIRLGSSCWDDPGRPECQFGNPTSILWAFDHNQVLSVDIYPARARSARARRACALRALGLLLADGTPTGGRGEDFLSRQPDFFTETAVTPERKVEKSFPRWEINRHVEG